MEMEFKDSSRRRTLVLVIGVLLAIAAGAAAFMLSSQGSKQPEVAFETRDVVVATQLIPARKTIEDTDVVIRPVPKDETNASAFTSRDEVVGTVAAIDIQQSQFITSNMLAGGSGIGAVAILKPNETVAPDSPYLRAVSLTVPPERAVGGYVADGQRVDIIATMDVLAEGALALPSPDASGEPLTDPETGALVAYTDGMTSKLTWSDVEVLLHPADTQSYILRTDLHTAEEIAQAQTMGAQFTLVLRPEEDTRDIDRSTYGETVDSMFTRYNFRLPQKIDGLTYGQPGAYSTPFPNEPYLTPAPLASPSPASAPVSVNPVESTAP